MIVQRDKIEPTSAGRKPFGTRPMQQASSRRWLVGRRVAEVQEWKKRGRYSVQFIKSGIGSVEIQGVD